MHPSQYNVKKRMPTCCFLEQFSLHGLCWNDDRHSRFPDRQYVDGNPRKTNILLPISYQIISIYAPHKAHLSCLLLMCLLCSLLILCHLQDHTMGPSYGYDYVC